MRKYQVNYRGQRTDRFGRTRWVGVIGHGFDDKVAAYDYAACLDQQGNRDVVILERNVSFRPWRNFGRVHDLLSQAA